MLERAENEIRQRRERAADLRAAGKVDEAEKLEVEAKAMAEKIRRVMAELRERESAPRDGDRRPDAPTLPVKATAARTLPVRALRVARDNQRAKARRVKAHRVAKASRRARVSAAMRHRRPVKDKSPARRCGNCANQ
jgi:hypothetical protein